VTANHQRFGSMVSIAPDDIDAFRVPVATPGFGAPPLAPLPVLLMLLLDPQAAASSAATAASADSARSGIRFLAITFSARFLLSLGRV
jgi:hypothetical protein